MQEIEVGAHAGNRSMGDDGVLPTSFVVPALRPIIYMLPLQWCRLTRAMDVTSDSHAMQCLLSWWV